jgi:hypothetical protein
MPKIATKPESLAKAAARLTETLGFAVSIKMVRKWKDKGYPLADADKDALIAKLRMQERNPLPPTEDADHVSESSGPLTDEDAPDPDSMMAAIEEIQQKMLAATDYETARMFSTKLKGLKDACALHRDQGKYVTRESQIRRGLRIGSMVKSMILKIPSELPQQVVGLDYPDTLRKCEDYAHAMLTQLIDDEQYDESQN